MWVGQSEVKVVLQNNGMEAFIPQVSSYWFSFRVLGLASYCDS